MSMDDLADSSVLPFAELAASSIGSINLIESKNSPVMRPDKLFMQMHLSSKRVQQSSLAA